MDKIIVLDFGSQYSHLICRRIREFSVYAELVPFDIPIDKLKAMNPKGVIFSGGPSSVYNKNSPRPDSAVFQMKLPLLGICYGHQLIVDNFGGKVKRSNKEYGHSNLTIDNNSIGEEFVRIFTEFAEENGPFKWLAQGTLYPDVIESGVSKGPAAVIKTHHNVGGLPDWLKLEVLEPLRDLYKDEVRKVAAILGVPKKLLMRHPFPGPGLAVRVIGDVTEKKLNIAKIASKIVEEELELSGWYDKVWQAYAAVGDDKAVGVVGDERKYGNIVMIRVVESIDAMTADWTRLPHDILAKISNRITNEIDEVTWVSYVISSKPPATIEPQ
ncbi:MAG: hypothetical protein EB170_02145 [Nitrosopumilaceae archaeon]|nr:hypothetical protein [Nitrosopumilaceae archaeon]